MEVVFLVCKTTPAESNLDKNRYAYFYPVHGL